MEIKTVRCNWCGKPETEWTTRVRWKSRGNRYCSARCFAAAEYHAHIAMAICSIPILSLLAANLVFILLSDQSLFYLVVEIWVLGIIFTYAGSCMYMISLGKSERQEKERDSSLL